MVRIGSVSQKTFSGFCDTEPILELAELGLMANSAGDWLLAADGWLDRLGSGFWLLMASWRAEAGCWWLAGWFSWLTSSIWLVEVVVHASHAHCLINRLYY